MDFQEIDRLVELSQQPLNNWLDSQPLPSEERRHYYRFLYYLVKTFEPKLVLEIGIEGGWASTYMLEAAREYGSYVIGLELNTCPTEALKQDPNYLFVQGDSTGLEAYLQVANYVESHGPLGLVFQDSSHHYQPSVDEWDLYSEMLARPGLWICDDITPSFHDPLRDPPGLGMVQYFESRPGEKKLYHNVLHRGNTQGVIILS